MNSKCDGGITCPTSCSGGYSVRGELVLVQTPMALCLLPDLDEDGKHVSTPSHAPLSRWSVGCLLCNGELWQSLKSEGGRVVVFIFFTSSVQVTHEAEAEATWGGDLQSRLEGGGAGRWLRG